ncbi:MAG: hypothetical protein GTN39_05800, partial [Candidatus Aenigmarchaeota archaeon]|nr:hypothetical protein [Candidatus Aenigmarchaeota archaeon]
RVSIGKERWKKPIVDIVAAHRTPYAATASVGFLNDLKEKVKKALEKDNLPSFIHVECPCPLGWKFDPSKTIEIAKLAVQTGMWILYEVHNGKLKITKSVLKRRPV